MKPLLAAVIASLLLAGAADARPRAQVVVTECRPALDPELRLAAFEGRARRIPGAERMQMRFTLQERSAGAWSVVEAEDWGEWTTSAAGVAEYRYTKEIGRLAAPAAYRTVVRFRWLDDAGAVIARDLAVSKRCRQPDLRPDLGVRDVVFRDGRYLVEVRNGGATRAPASQLELVVDGVERRVVAVGPVRARSTRTVEVAAPRCTPGGPGVSVYADHGDAVDERDEADNGRVLGCP